MSSVVFCFAIEGQRVIHVYTVSCMTAGLLSSTLDMHDGMAYYVVYIYINYCIVRVRVNL